MSREDLHFRLRLPDDLKSKIQEAASRNHRSMTAEIVARLESTFPQTDEGMRAEATEEFRILTRMIEAIEKRLDQAKIGTPTIYDRE